MAKTQQVNLIDLENLIKQIQNAIDEYKSKKLKKKTPCPTNCGGHLLDEGSCYERCSKCDWKNEYFD